MVSGWSLAFILVIIFQCKPINGVWDRSVQSKCLSIKAIAFSSAAISIAEDFLILLMPITQLIGLQMTLRKKLNLLGMFSVGAFATITSIIRLKFIVSLDNSADPTWDNVIPIVWSLIEINVAIICACLPSIRALLSGWLPSLFDLTHKSSAALHSVSTKRTTTKWSLDPNITDKGRFNSGVSITGRGESDGPSENEYEMSGIMRKIDVDIVRASLGSPRIRISEVDSPVGIAEPRRSDIIDVEARGSEDNLFNYPYEGGPPKFPEASRQSKGRGQ
jgi:hypothetical protein